MPTTDDVQRYRVYLQDETDGAFYYRTLAEIEEDEGVREVYSAMAAMEERHRDLWRREIEAAGGDPGSPRPTRRARLLMWLARRFGTDMVIPVLKANEAGADRIYAGEPVARREGLPADERSHYRLFNAMERPVAGIPGSLIGRIESRHRAIGGGNALRAAVLGANDGLVSNLALVMGVAGASPGQATVVLAGLAGLVAGAFSMALGEWISVMSAREAGELLLAEEREEIALMPQAERDELALIYRAKGFAPGDADRLADQIMADPEHALATLAREELGVVPEDLGSPWIAAIASFVLFALGAVVPLLPFLLAGGLTAILVSAAASAAGLFVLGAGITLLTGRPPLYAGARQTVLGLAAAALTFAVGVAVGQVATI